MGGPTDQEMSRGRWMALAAALLGWMFDGLEMGLFPLVARPSRVRSGNILPRQLAGISSAQPPLSA